MSKKKTAIEHWFDDYRKSQEALRKLFTEKIEHPKTKKPTRKQVAQKLIDEGNWPFGEKKKIMAIGEEYRFDGEGFYQTTRSMKKSNPLK